MSKAVVSSAPSPQWFEHKRAEDYNYQGHHSRDQRGGDVRINRLQVMHLTRSSEHTSHGSLCFVLISVLFVNPASRQKTAKVQHYLQQA